MFHFFFYVSESSSSLSFFETCTMQNRRLEVNLEIENVKIKHHILNIYLDRWQAGAIDHYWMKNISAEISKHETKNSHVEANSEYVNTFY